MNKLYTFVEVTEITGIESSTIELFIHQNWISPVEKNSLDEEDLARVQLIEELRSRIGTNDEAIPIILHLLDQVYHLRSQIRRQQCSLN